MRQVVALLVLISLPGCEGDNISACAYACKQGGHAMASYSATTGCVCKDACPKADP